MRYIKHVLIVCLFAIASVIAPVTLASQASAATSYDSVINPVSDLELYGDPGCDPINLTNTWDEEITSRYTGAELSSFVNRKALVVTAGYKTGSNLISSVSVAWWGPNDENATAEFSSESVSDKTFNNLSITSGTTYFERFRQMPGRCGVLMNEGLDMQIGVSLGAEVQPTGSPAYNSVRPFEVSGVDINYLAGYEGVHVPGQATYVAMGDSFSSGEGNPWYEAGSDNGSDPGKDVCHRSPEAYPRLLSRDGDLNLGRADFVACSGATTANVLSGGSSDGAWNERAQVKALSDDTRVVTLIVGGNDVGFASYALGCTVNCGPGAPTYSAIMAAISAPAFESNLKTTYEAVLAQAPNAQVYVADYPYMSKEYTQQEILMGEGRCGYFNLNGTRDVQSALNAVIAQAISSVASSRLHYVPTNAAGSPFANKYLCSDLAASDFGEATLHPNYDGHDDYAAVIKGALQP